MVATKTDKSLKYVHLVGIELEGGWDAVPPSRTYTDVSLRDIKAKAIVGETASPPSLVKECLEFIDLNCPDHTNETCGFHVHVSLKRNSDYVRLMNREFYAFFLKWMEKWGKDMNFPDKHLFWERLHGKNQFSRKEFHAEDQSVAKVKEGFNKRRCQLNYCYAMHGTLECRLFPGFNNRDHFKKAMLSFVACVEAFLEGTEGADSLLKEVTVSLKEENDDLVEVE